MQLRASRVSSSVRTVLAIAFVPLVVAALLPLSGALAGTPDLPIQLATEAGVGGASFGTGVRSMSDDGRYIVFDSDGEHDPDALALSDHRQVFRHDTWTGETVLISHIRNQPGYGNGDSIDPTISADGSVVAFQSLATNLVSSIPDTNNDFDVFVWDAEDPNELTTYSINSNFEAAGGYHPGISPDGLRVVFTSQGPIAPATGNPSPSVDVWMIDRSPDFFFGSEKVSLSEEASNLLAPQVTDDGTVAYLTRHRTELKFSVQWWRDNGQAGIDRRTIESPAGSGSSNDGTFGATAFSMSRDGQAIAFTSDNDLDGTDGGQGTRDIWYWNAAHSAVARVTEGGSSTVPVLSANGQVVVAVDTDRGIVHWEYSGTANGVSPAGTLHDIVRWEGADPLPEVLQLDASIDAKTIAWGARGGGFTQDAEPDDSREQVYLLTGAAAIRVNGIDESVDPVVNVGAVNGQASGPAGSIRVAGLGVDVAFLGDGPGFVGGVNADSVPYLRSTANTPTEVTATPTPTPTPTTTPGPGGSGTEPLGAGVQRLTGASDDPIDIAIAACQRLVPDAGGAARIVLGRDDVFADLLGGAPLAGEDGCALLTTGGPDAALHPAVADEIARALPAGGPVHMLGGVNVLSQAVADELVAAGFDVQRLEGPSRVETALDVADEVLANNPGTSTAMVAYAFNFADALMGGAYGAETGIPIVLSPTDELHPATAQWLADNGITNTIVLGGPVVLSDEVMDALPTPVRVFGSTRMGTSVAIVEQLWEPHLGGPADQYLLANIEADNGWTLALAAAPLAAALDAPQLGVGGTRYPAEAATHLGGHAVTSALLLGPESFIDAATAAAIAEDVG